MYPEKEFRKHIIMLFILQCGFNHMMLIWLMVTKSSFVWFCYKIVGWYATGKNTHTVCSKSKHSAERVGLKYNLEAAYQTCWLYSQVFFTTDIYAILLLEGMTFLNTGLFWKVKNTLYFEKIPKLPLLWPAATIDIPSFPENMMIKVFTCPKYWLQILSKAHSGLLYHWG